MKGQLPLSNLNDVPVEGMEDFTVVSGNSMECAKGVESIFPKEFPPQYKPEGRWINFGRITKPIYYKQKIRKKYKKLWKMPFHLKTLCVKRPTEE
jgi:hypothetical protein